MTAKEVPAPGPVRRYVPAVGPKLRKLLIVVLVMFGLLSVNSIYLAGISLLEWTQDQTYQDYFYQYMFLAHLLLGMLLLIPALVYGCIHLANAHGRTNRRAVRVGYALFGTVIVLLLSGLVLSRGIPVVEVRHPFARELAYWFHVATPLAVAWLFILHRLAGPRIRWRVGGQVALLAALVAGLGIGAQTQDPRSWNVEGPQSGEQYFFPSLARTTSGNFIPAESLMVDGYCQQCHGDTHRGWSHSMHRFASFNNPAYLFSVRNTREFMLERDGNVQGARFCAGCHDPVPFFSGAFDDPEFDDVKHPSSQAGITCSVCHSITHINSPRGNADYTIDEPLHYPFAFSDNATLRWVNQFLVKAKPEFHKKTFLKPLHRTPEFCSTCHKVHLPEEFNHYKWLRGQNHYDTYHLSGVSGHGVASFYYPKKAVHTCNACHMPLRESTDFGARDFDGSGELSVHTHQFLGANTAVPHLLAMPDWVNNAQREFLKGSLRVDIFGVRSGATVTGELSAPLRPALPTLIPGKAYLLEVVLRTLKLGHLFTQGTADSNEVWLDVSLTSDGREIGRSGALDAADGDLDPWAHRVNAYVLDRDGNRIDRRNPENIFTALYNHQIPPGASDVIHYRFEVPDDIDTAIVVQAKLRYRKFDTSYMRQFIGPEFERNDLPVVTIATDTVVLPVEGKATNAAPSSSNIEAWQRWNDYGIGLLRRGGTGELRQAEEAFKRVEALGRADGALNAARVYIREGRLDDAVEALGRATRHEPPALPWSVTYFTGIVNAQNGYLDEAISNYRDLVETRFSDARRREFDFLSDYRLLNRLAQTLFERSKLERGESQRETRDSYLADAGSWFDKALVLDPENVAAHYGLAQIHAALGDDARASEHRRLHATYKVDDNARDRAVAIARRNSAPANHAANDVVIYDLTPSPELLSALQPES